MKRQQPIVVNRLAIRQYGLKEHAVTVIVLGQAVLTDYVATQERLADVDRPAPRIVTISDKDPTVGSRLTKHHRGYPFAARVLRPRLKDLRMRNRVVVKHPYPPIRNRVKRVVFELLTTNVLALPVESPMPNQIDPSRATSGGKRRSDLS